MDKLAFQLSQYGMVPREHVTYPTSVKGQTSALQLRGVKLPIPAPKLGNRVRRWCRGGQLWWNPIASECWTPWCDHKQPSNMGSSFPNRRTQKDPKVKNKAPCSLWDWPESIKAQLLIACMERAPRSCTAFSCRTCTLLLLWSPGLVCRLGSWALAVPSAACSLGRKTLKRWPCHVACSELCNQIFHRVLKLPVQRRESTEMECVWRTTMNWVIY